MLDRQHLAILLEVDRLGSVTAAAERLNVTQSALSHMIRKVEERHGVKLWTKSGRGLRFTQAGQYLLALAQRVLPQIDHAERVLVDYAQGRRGALRVGMECHPCQKWLSRLTPHYLAAWPDVDFDVRTAFRFDGVGALLGHEIDLILGIGAAQTEAQRATGLGVRQAERLQHVAGLTARRRAGRARGERDALERQHDGIGIDTAEGDVEVARQALGRVSVEMHVRETVRDLLPEAIAQSTEPLRLFLQVLENEFDGTGEAHDQGDRQRARAQATLVSASVDQRFETNPWPPPLEIEHADPLRSVELVGAHGEKIDAECIHVHGNLAHRLGRIGVEENLVFGADVGDLAERLEHTDFAVGGHDRDQQRPFGDAGRHVARADETVGSHGKAGHREPFGLERIAAVEHSRVLDGGRNQVIPWAPLRPGDALERQVVGLCRRPDNNTPEQTPDNRLQKIKHRRRIVAQSIKRSSPKAG